MKVRTFGFNEIDQDRHKTCGLTASPGIVIVEMAPRAEDWGGILLPDMTKTRIRQDVGVVLAAGGPYKAVVGRKKVVSDPSDVPPGSIVVVNRKRGLCVSKLAGSRSEVRLYGVSGGRYSTARYPYDDAILAVVDNMQLRATGRGVIVRVEKKEQGPILTLNEEVEVIATVVSAGKDSGYAEGNKIVVNPAHMYEFLGEFEGLAHVYAEQIYGVYNG